jgi:hypothetical protein
MPPADKSIKRPFTGRPKKGGTGMRFTGILKKAVAVNRL